MKAQLIRHTTSVLVSLEKFAEAQTMYGGKKKHAVNCLMRVGGRAFILSCVSQLLVVLRHV